MGKKHPPEIAKHIHSDINVDQPRLDALAEEPRTIQLLVFAALRERTVEENVELPVAAIAFAVILPFAATFVTPEESDAPLWAKAIVIGVLALVFTIVIFLAIGLSPLQRHRRRELATVWIGAFEDELARRHRNRSWSTRRWRKSH